MEQSGAIRNVVSGVHQISGEKRTKWDNVNMIKVDQVERRRCQDDEGSKARGKRSKLMGGKKKYADEAS